MKNIVITIEKTETGFSAYSTDIKGIYTVATDFEELKRNSMEVFEEQANYLKEIGKTQDSEELRTASIEYKIDWQQFFEQYSMINKSEFAKYIGINPSLLRQYSKGLVLYPMKEF